MHSAIALLALAAAASAAPVAEVAEVAVVGSSDFSAPAIKNPNYVRNGTAALLKAYAKHNLSPPQECAEAFTAELNGLKSAKRKRQDSSAPASPSEGVEYLVETDVGGQKLNLDFDTGSGDLWVFSTSLSASSQANHHVFNPSSSSTYKAMSGATWRITYGDGSGASGTVGTDTVTVGGTTVKGQAVELATRVSAQFVQDASDGLLGLSFSNINTVQPTQQKTFFDNAKSSLTNPLFAAYLPLNADGAYDFGAINAQHHTGSVVYTDVDSSGGFWQFPSTSYKVGGTTHSLSRVSAIADTGTTLLLIADAAVTTYYDAVQGASFDNQQGGYTFPCSATLPDFAVRIGSTNYATIPGSLINFAPIDNSGRTCFGGIQSVGQIAGMGIYGDVFFNAYYGVFDDAGPRFGFAPIA
ncbi:hypothetical protein HYFRA_00000057 [Hymenoscyphus fraxineus]|uniref:Peptidase A1 domain-containing protein n=1 Tax=Hymenoscyphus fraxineus TaxID=746836 RepID=A0A9N9L351_9HELO|nr:hypothetical protein HYFRA_00000057 [Hymenoscyphus fraxineus]